jgi:hypothetical protein
MGGAAAPSELFRYRLGARRSCWGATTHKIRVICTLTPPWRREGSAARPHHVCAADGVLREREADTLRVALATL